MMIVDLLPPTPVFCLKSACKQEVAGFYRHRFTDPRGAGANHGGQKYLQEVGFDCGKRKGHHALLRTAIHAPTCSAPARIETTKVPGRFNFSVPLTGTVLLYWQHGCGIWGDAEITADSVQGGVYLPDKSPAHTTEVPDPKSRPVEGRGRRGNDMDLEGGRGREGRGQKRGEYMSSRVY